MSAAIQREAVERVARVYHQSQDAARALGITERSLNRLCRRFDIETPAARRRRQARRAAA
jgi:hypothetical protein